MHLFLNETYILSALNTMISTFILIGYASCYTRLIFIGCSIHNFIHNNVIVKRLKLIIKSIFLKIYSWNHLAQILLYFTDCTIYSKTVRYRKIFISHSELNNLFLLKLTCSYINVFQWELCPTLIGLELSKRVRKFLFIDNRTACLTLPNLINKFESHILFQNLHKRTFKFLSVLLHFIYIFKLNDLALLGQIL